VSRTHPITIDRPFPGCAIVTSAAPDPEVLAPPERVLHASLPSPRQDRWIRGRIAARDALEQVLPGPLPSGLAILREESGAPRVEGLPGAHVSIAHAGARSAAIASDTHPVAVDFEEIRAPSHVLLDRGFTAEEREWLDAQPDRALAATRLWAAREVASKLAGTGLQGQPRRWPMREATAHSITIGEVRVATRVLDDHVLASSPMQRSTP